MGDKSWDGEAREAIELDVHRRRSEQDVQHVVLHFFVGKRRLASISCVSTTERKVSEMYLIYVQITIDPNLRCACRIFSGCRNHTTKCRAPMPKQNASRRPTWGLFGSFRPVLGKFELIEPKLTSSLKMFEFWVESDSLFSKLSANRAKLKIFASFESKLKLKLRFIYFSYYLDFFFYF